MKTLIFFRTLPLLIVALAFGSCSKSTDPAPVADTKYLLLNPSAESGTTTPDNWIPYYSNPYGTYYKAEWANDQAIEGTRSLKINASATNGPNSAFWYQRVESATAKLAVGKTVTFTVKIKTDNITEGIEGQGVSINLGTYAGTTTATQFISTLNNIEIKGTSDWTTYRITLPEKVASGTSLILIQLLLTAQTTGTVYFDDMSLIAQ